MGLNDARLGLRLLELQREYNDLVTGEEFASSFGLDPSGRAGHLGSEYAATLRELLSP